MDTALTFPTWANVFTFFSGVSIVLIPLLITRWLDRKKSFVEVRETETRAELNIVSARSTELRDDLATGEGVGRMLGNLIEAGDQLSELQQQVFELRGRVMRAEADAQAAQLFVEQLTAAAKLAMCEHHPHGVRLSDYMPQQLKDAMGHERRHT